MKRECGNCRFFGTAESSGYHPCTWKKPLPFWACIDPDDHEDWVLSGDGSSCRAYEENPKVSSYNSF